jgi:hypothetical protein
VDEKNQHLTHLDPEKHWIGGGFAQLMRLRVILSFFSVGTLSQIVLHIFKSAPESFVVAISTAVIIVTAVLFGLRRVYLRSLRTHASLRKFCQEIAEAMAEHKGHTDIQSAQSVYKAIVRNTLHVFNTIRPDRSLATALRVAKKVAGHKGFHTVAREGDYDTRRQGGSQPVPEGKGLPNLLAERGGGVYIVNDIPAAVSQQSWHPTPNDHLGDLKYAVVANITTPYEQDGVLRPATLGVLSVTSRRSRFSPGFETATLEICASIAAHALASTLREHKRAEERDLARLKEGEVAADPDVARDRNEGTGQ